VSEVTIRINGRGYRVSCADGEENRLQELAQYVDRKVTGLAREVGSTAGEITLMLLGALAVADDLANQLEQLQDLKERLEAAEAEIAGRRAADAARERALGEAGTAVEKLAERVERLASALDSA